MSPAFTVTMMPLTGGMISFWPRFRSSLLLRSFAHQIVIIETPNLLAIPVSVSPARTS